jgi:hypothetical protein
MGVVHGAHVAQGAQGAQGAQRAHVSALVKMWAARAGFVAVCDFWRHNSPILGGLGFLDLGFWILDWEYGGE